VDEQHETDDRFPTGEWMGFYMQPDGRRRYRMDLFLEFVPNAITGRGTDAIGEFAIRGAYDAATARCEWTKQYVGGHGVEYTGVAGRRGIVGRWSIPGQPASWSGPFFVWPRALGDRESEFEKAFLEYDLPEASAASFSEGELEPASVR